jgi:tetratricopeptide (TPR) repeat protein
MASQQRPVKGHPRALVPGVFILLSGLLMGCGDGIPNFTPEDLAEVTAQVMEAYQLHDYEFGAELGEKWAGWAPDAVELKAWTVANYCGAGLLALGEKMAGEMAAAYPDSPWTSFATAAVGVRFEDEDRAEKTLEASEKAFAGLPGQIEAAILRGGALSTYRDSDAVMAFVSTLPEELLAHPDARTAMVQTKWPENPYLADGAVDEILPEYEAILQDHPNHPSTLIDAAVFLDANGEDPEELLSYAERAAALTPSPEVHGLLWKTILAAPSTSTDDQKDRVTADVRETLEAAEESAARIAAMALRLGESGMTELQSELEAQVLDTEPESWAAEMIVAKNLETDTDEFFEAPFADPQEEATERARLVASLEAYIDRPEHYAPKPLIEAFWSLFFFNNDDPDVDPVYLSELALGWADRVQTSSHPLGKMMLGLGAIPLAERGDCNDVAKHIIAMGWEEVGHGEPEVQGDGAEPEESPSDDTEAGGEEDAADDPLAAMEKAETEAVRVVLTAAEGLLLAGEGRLDEAEEKFEKLKELEPTSTTAAVASHLYPLFSGRLAETRADLAEADGREDEAQKYLEHADEMYSEGVSEFYMARPAAGNPWKNPNETALEALYQRMNGGLEGFEEHLAAAKDETYEERREDVLAARIEDPEPVMAFALQALDGEEVRSDQFLGQVVIINFWGTW